MREIVVLGLFLLATLVTGQAVQTGCLVQVPGSLKCQVCNASLQLDDQGHCGLYTPIEGCKVYQSSSSGGCSECQSSFLLQGPICVAMLPHCIETSSVYSCDRCADNYTLVRFSSCFSTDTANCPLGSLPRTANGASYCEQMAILNCDVPSADRSSCQLCASGYTVINGICYQVLSSSPCKDNSCACQGYYFNSTCYNIKISNCLASTDKVYCDLCDDGYYASQGFCFRFTKQDDINCNLLTLDGTRCAGCNLNYVLDSDFICVRNFELCPQGCSQCPPNFKLYEDNCLPNDPLCAVYNATKQACVLCLEGYQLDPRTMVCVKKVTCLARDQSGSCVSCFTGYQLDTVSRQCLSLPPNCWQMNTTSGICLQCSNVTSLSSSGCIFPTTNCTSYNFYGRCQTCSEGYVQVRRFCLPIASNCRVYSTDKSKCSICNSGYHIYSTLCYADIDGCQAYQRESYCSLCGDNYQLINGNCFFRDPNCVAQDDRGLCLGCKQGYLPARGRCVFFDPYCLSYNTTSLVCSLAFGGFAASGMNTQQKVAYQDFVMRAQSASKEALSQDFGGAVGMGSYSRNGIINELAYSGLNSSSVLRYTINGNILLCQQGYTLISGRCVKKLQNAYSYDQYGNVLQCNPGYDILSDGSCAQRSTSTCATATGGVCLAAASGFTLVNGAAVASSRYASRVSAEGLVISAFSGYFVWREMNVAWPLDVNCLSQFVPKTCVSCDVGFSLWNDGRCVFYKANCVAYSWSGICMGCADGYLLWAGECRRSNCASLDPFSRLCLVCSSPFVMSLGVCLPPTLQYCQVYQNGTCLYCIPGYYLTASGLCAKMINNCLSANPQTGRCVTCLNNYTYYNQQCIPEIPNCNVYSSSLQSCQTCAQLYYPIYSGSICGYLGLFCSVLVTQKNCAQCKPGFKLITQNGSSICVRLILNCYWYDTKANCMICNTGYVLQFNACKSIRCANFFPPQSRCDACLAPYILENNHCKDPNCQNSTGEVCLSCLPRYYLKNGVCVLISDDNCQSVSIDGTCLKCLQGYELNVTSGLCVANDTIYNGCQRQEYPCTSCALGYVLRSDGLCWARKCRVFKNNRDCQTCIYYYDLEPTQRFCILYTCASPSCYLNDNPPDGFYVDSNGNLSITYCLNYNGADCLSCSNYRFPNPSVRFGLCYPYNCRSDSILNCTNQCLTYFTNVAAYPGSCLAANCSAYSQNGLCISCLDNFTLVNGTCLLFQIKNCLTIDYVNRVCSVCRGGYIPWDGRCRPANCSAYSSDGLSCLTCLQGYILVRGICQPGKCSSLQGQLCLECLPGYYLLNGLCYASNCQRYDPQALICLACDTQYELVSNLGVCKPQNCISYTASLQTCLQCVPSYVLVNGLCVRGDPNCLSFDDNGKCLQCKDNLVNANGTCVTKVAGCSQYSPSGCSTCLPAFELRNGLCYARYCQNYSTADYCLKCDYRWSVQADGSCLPRNCLTFDRNTWKCTVCEARFQLISTFCFTYNCSNYQVGVYQCQRCQSGFTLVDDTCTFSNCLAPNQLTCSSCLSGFTLSQGLCKAPQDHCAQYDFSQFVCTQCAPGYNLSTYGLCQSTFVDPFCLSVESSSGRCLECLPFFTYNQVALQCQSSYCSAFNPANPQRGRVCVSCLPGFALDSSQRYCISIYCLRYDLSGGNCWACIGGASLNNNVCYANFCSQYSQTYPSSPVCQSCKPGYQLNTNSLCVPQYCSSLNLDLSCSKCLEGYTLTSTGICQSISCDNGFVFLNGECRPANCQYYNKTAGGCSVCLPGFVQEGQSCVAAGCLSYNNKYICLECAPGYSLKVVNGQTLCVLDISSTCPSGYYFNNNSCILIPIANCSIADPSGQKCYRCLEGYLLRNNVCYLIDGCLWPSFITGCKACLPGYVLNGFLCVSLNCQQIYPNNTCKNCLQGYTLVSGQCQRNVYMCLQLDSNGNCLRCQSDFQLTNGRCIAIGCLTYSPSTYVCLQCSSGYVLQSDGRCEVRITIPNCFSPVNSTFCGICDNGYIQLLGKCYIRINWCLSYYDQNGLCSKCSAGYYVNSQGQCFPLPSFCQQADSNGKCQLCNQGYRVFNGQCLPNIQYCEGFDPNTGLCLNCMTNYYLTSDGLCRYIPAFCTGALPSGDCTGCQSGYQLVAGTCVVKIAYCLIYNTNNPAYCFQCVNGYYLNSRYGCSVLPPFCTAADGTGVCLSCVQSYSLVNSLCVVPVPNCIRYVQTPTLTRCSQCASGFNLTANFSCSSLPQYCSVGSNGVCTSCIAGYQLYQSICVIVTQNCRYWSVVSLQCSDCVSGYYLSVNGSSSGYICKTLPEFCLRADIFGGCLQCINSYTIYNQQCVDTASIRFCRVYNLTTFTCLECVSGYTLNSQSRCLPRYCSSVDNQGNCIACLSQYKLVNGLCVIEISNCGSYNPDSGLCFSCLNGYTLSNDGRTCFVNDQYCSSMSSNGNCIACINGYYLSQGRCYSLPIGCASVGNNGYCISCLPQYQLFNNICLIAISNCLSYNTDTRLCVSCASGYTLSNNGRNCIMTDQYCASTNSNGECVACINGYYLSQGRCYSMPVGCASMGNNGYCLQCLSQYQLVNNICLIPISNCLSYNTDSRLCVSCASGYTLSNNGRSCIITDQYCASTNSNGECLACIKGYYLNQGRCYSMPAGCTSIGFNGQCIGCLPQYLLYNNICLIRIDNCMNYNPTSGLCIGCASGYTLSNDGRTCSRTDQYCISFGQNGFCLDCASGYYLSQGRCFSMPIGCTSMGFNGLCIACQSQYLLINSGVCVLRVPYCQSYNASGCSLCTSLYYLQSNACKPYPLGCLSYQLESGRCLNCASDYQLNYTSWTCYRRSDCQNYNGNQCVYCPLRHYLSMGQCRPYPNYCVSVDLMGNCISCAFGSKLSGNSCQPTQGRKLNCLNYDSINSICITCADGYSLCPATGVCVRPDPGCQNFTFEGECLACKGDYVLYRGECLLYPPGVVLMPNGGVSCRSGYSLVDGSCLRNENTMSMASANPTACSFGGSSGINQQPFLGSSFYWRPTSVQLNQYISIRFTTGRPQAIFQVGVRGTQQGWVSGYVLQFKNREDAPWICWNGCEKVTGNSDGGSTSWLKVYHPIVATELRLYPVSWVGDMALQVDLWMLFFS